MRAASDANCIVATINGHGLSTVEAEREIPSERLRRDEIGLFSASCAKQRRRDVARAADAVVVACWRCDAPRNRARSFAVIDDCDNRSGGGAIPQESSAITLSTSSRDPG